MTLKRLAIRSAVFHWRSHLAVVLCLALASMVITGSMLIGHSIQSSLRDRLVGHTGGHRAALSSSGLMGEGPDLGLLRLTGSASSETGEAVPDVRLWGAPTRFAPFVPQPGEAALTSGLANDLRVKAGDRIFLRVAKPSAVPTGSLFAQRTLDDSTLEVPVTVKAIISTNGIGGFDLRPSFRAPRNVFVDLHWLQARVRAVGKVNVLLDRSRRLTLADHGLSMQGITVHSDQLVFTQEQVSACQRAARLLGGDAGRVSVALASEVRCGARYSHYAIAAWVESRLDRKREAVLGDWLATDLVAKAGQKLSVTFLHPKPDGSFVETVQTLPLGNTSHDAPDDSLTPALDGVSDAPKLSDWKTPFPVDLAKVSPRDETYWDRFRAAPKLFVDRQTISQAWDGADMVTGVQIILPRGVSTQQFRDALVRELSPDDSGLTTIALTADAEKAAEGSADMGSLMLGLGAVLVAAALGLAGTVLSLSVQARSKEVALLSALGVGAWQAFSIEGGIILAFGAVAGAVAGVPFAALSLSVLVRLMPAAMFGGVALHVGLVPLLVGAVATMIVGAAALSLALRNAMRTRLRGRSPRWASMPGRFGPVKLVVRNAFWRPGRFALSLLLTCASAFLLTAIAGSVREGVSGIDKATGGFSLIATTTVPLAIGFDTAEGRARLGFEPEDEKVLSGIQVFGLLRSPGEDTSCLNPAKPSRPRLAALSPELTSRGLFGISPEVLARLQEPVDIGNPMPAVGDEESVQWILGSGIGEVATTAYGPVRFAALTHGTVLSSDILVGQKAFLRMVPGVTAPTLFLVKTPPGTERQVAGALRRGLSDAGIDVRETLAEVEALHAVQNAYLSIFLGLGLLALALGVLGTSLLALRGAIERRAESALLAALGVGRGKIGVMLASESFVAVAIGLVVGTGLGLTVGRQSSVWVLVAAACILVTHLLTSIILTWSQLRRGTLEALRTE